MIKTIGVEELGVILRKAPGTIKENARIKPWVLPPRIVIDGKPKLLWNAAAVNAWLVEHEEKEVR